MITLRADLHCHTVFSDGRGTPEACVVAAYKKGIDVLAITDHNTAEGAMLYWEHQPDLPITVIPGEEISTEKGHVLAYFIKKTIQPGPYIQVVQQIRQQGGLAFMAHPYHIPLKKFWTRPHTRLTEIDLEMLDGFEVNNGHNRSRANRDASRLAQRHEHQFTFLSGSDAHFPWEIGGCTSSIEVKECTLDAIYDSLCKRRVEPNPPSLMNRLFYQWCYYWVGMGNRLSGKKYTYQAPS